MTDGHHSTTEPIPEVGLKSVGEGPDHRPTEHRWQTAIIEKRYLGGDTTGDRRFCHDLGMPAGTKDEESAHRCSGLPMKGDMVDSPSALMPSRRNTFQMVIRTMRKSSPKL